MRPHRLRLTAFGPFAEEVEVDFDAMAAGGLFLLQGDTGAGKTSILDGLAFALYGRVPGQRSGVNRLRSDHAAPGTATKVELEVTIARRRFRIERWPEQERPKRRGSGTTRDQARINLFEAGDGGWLPLSQRMDEANAELSRLLGMSVDQFQQVVLLPQGEFARFLRSDAGERAKLLQQLFATERFRRVEDWLADRRRATAAELDAARAAVWRLAARVAQAAGVPEAEPDEHELPIAGWATELATAARGRATEAEALAEQNRRRQVEAEAAWDRAQELERRQRRRRELLDRQDRLERERPAVQAAAARLSDAQRAAPVRSDLERVTQRQLVLEQVEGQLRTARAAVAPELRTAGRDELLAQSADRRHRLGRLDAAQRLEDDLVAERTRATESAAAAEAASAAVAAQEAELAALPQQRERLVAAQVEADAARLQIPTLEAERDRLERAVGDVRALQAARQQRAVAAEELLAARELAVSLHEEAGRLREERVDSMIAELAAALVDGDPCPVCGATEHPDLSEVRGSRVTREQEDAARDAAERAQQAVADLRAAMARQDAEIEGRTTRLSEAGEAQSTADQLSDAVRDVDARLACARRTVANGEQVGAQLAEWEERQRSLVDSAARARQERELAATAAKDATSRAGEFADRLAALLDGASHVQEARRREQRMLAQLDELVDLLARAETAVGELSGAQAALAAALTAAGFDSVDAAGAALLPAVEMTELQHRVDQARSAEAAVAAALADPDVAVDLAIAADVAVHESAVFVARLAARDATSAADRAAVRADDLAGLAPHLERELAAVAPVRERAAQVRHLADLAAGNGANRLRMTLSAYVLAARLEEVAAVASERLRRMTQGRYSLVHTDVGRGGGRSGLGLLARDAWTGQDRDTATLSGGETFLASLALALALGDVVMAESGGAEVEALFVDEGFGTLDEETLEEVMDTLDALRENGRMVGLVSHVGELRSRIPAQIHVRKGRNGSSITLQPA